jgi:hypothetical protein
MVKCQPSKYELEASTVLNRYRIWKNVGGWSWPEGFVFSLKCSVICGMQISTSWAEH